MAPKKQGGGSDLHETAFLMGQMSADLKNVKDDIKGLTKSMGRLHKDVNLIKLKIFALGAAGAVCYELFMTMFKKWKGGG